MIAAIKTAREFGDLSENFEYHAAKNEQGLLEARIRTLRARLEGAEIVADAGTDEVGVGSVVDIEGDSGQTMTVEVSAVGGAGTVSPTSPLGSALLGKKLGETVEVQAPKGAWTATIKRIQLTVAWRARRCSAHDAEPVAADSATSSQPSPAISRCGRPRTRRRSVRRASGAASCRSSRDTDAGTVMSLLAAGDQQRSATRS